MDLGNLPQPRGTVPLTILTVGSEASQFPVQKIQGRQSRYFELNKLPSSTESLFAKQLSALGMKRFSLSENFFAGQPDSSFTSIFNLELAGSTFHKLKLRGEGIRGATGPKSSSSLVFLTTLRDRLVCVQKRSAVSTVFLFGLRHARQV